MQASRETCVLATVSSDTRCQPLEDGQPLSLLLDFGLARLAGGSGKLAARCLAGRNGFAAPAILHRPVTTRVAAAMSKRQPVICR